MTYSNIAVTKLNVKDLCGSSTLTRTDGHKLFKFILSHWEDPKIIEVDFGNRVIASVSFLDEALGQLALRFDREELGSKLKLSRIASNDKKLLNEIINSRYREKIKTKKAA